MIKFGDWTKLEIRIGKVVKAEKVENADKLLKLIIDFGSEKKQVLTAMAEYFEPDHFLNKQIPVLVNLEPRTIRGLESQGMILAAEVEGKPVLIHPEEEVPNGSKVE